MQFMVKGAERTSGKDRSYIVMAESTSDAESWGGSQGLLVESVTNLDPHDITGSAAILRTIGMILILAAVVSMAIGCICGVLATMAASAPEADQAKLESMGVIAGSALGSGLFGLAIGAGLRMLASIGLTLRDAHGPNLPRSFKASSSFRPPSISQAAPSSSKLDAVGNAAGALIPKKLKRDLW